MQFVLGDNSNLKIDRASTNLLVVVTQIQRKKKGVYSEGLTEFAPLSRMKLSHKSKDEREVFTLRPEQVKLLPHHQWSCESNPNKKERCLL